MNASPLQRALRNSIVISLIVAALVMVQKGSALDSLLTGLFTFAVTLPALWLSFRYTQRIAEKYAASSDDDKQP
ncbi:hypothetical protein [Thiomicrorhabdus cannonii]|uniref:hypothetical protein n=1 Tax=Thiomicrorhabdus cannonii TaxID=2748011 RepID=UPI0015C11890|nr:hypothetical protein [Thiomicrorhabdus cannonii]